MKKEAFDLKALQLHLQYVFKDCNLLSHALTHSSYSHNKSKSLKDNQRLEFLGDRVLGLLTAEFLFKKDMGAQEGLLAIQLNRLVCKETCARMAQKMRLGEVLLLSSSEMSQGGRKKDTILADACEAVLAAIYLDGGLSAVRKVYAYFWKSEFKSINEITKDPKSSLQDWTLKHGHQTPVYTVISKAGADHLPIFRVRVSIFNGKEAEGSGKSKRDAEYAAAEYLLKALSL